MKQNIMKFGQLGLLALVIVGLVACSGGESTADTAVPTATTAVVSGGDTDAPTVEPTAVTTSAETSSETAVVEESATEVPVEAVAAVENTKLNLNEATGDDYLATIPDFSSRMGREFLEYRPYISILQFRQEMGKYVSDDQVAVYEQYVYVPVAVDDSDAATLMQLPGVDETIAASLMGERPFGSNEAFLAALANYVSAEDASAAAGYLSQ